MLKNTLLRTLILMLFALAAANLAACGDDSSNDNDTNGPADTTGGDTNTPPDSTDDTATDTTTNPDTRVEFAWAATSAEYTGGQTTYLVSLAVPTVGSEGPACCRDWGAASRDYVVNGTDEMDNALAELNGFLGGLSLDLSPIMNDRIADGSLVVLFDHFELDGATDADGFILAGLLAQFAAGTTFTEASAGTGSFEVFESAFKGGTGEPLVTFGGAAMTSGAMVAGPSTFNINTQLTNMALNLNISDATLTGDATIGADGVTYANGTLSGYIAVTEVVGLVNAYLRSDTCSCLNLTADVYTVSATGEVTGNCVTDAHTLCTTEANSTCATVASTTQDGSFDVCGILPATITGMADIDIDGDCATDPSCGYEALSLGLEWTGVPANITAVVP